MSTVTYRVSGYKLGYNIGYKLKKAIFSDSNYFYDWQVIL